MVAKFKGGIGSLQSQEFLTSGTFIVPLGVTTVWVTMIGGGASGAAARSANACAGGGGSGFFYNRIAVAVTPEDEIPVIIGAGGPAVNGSSNTAVKGVDGGTTSFGALAAKGGKGGRAEASENVAVTGLGGVGGANGGTATMGEATRIYPEAFNGNKSEFGIATGKFGGGGGSGIFGGGGNGAAIAVGTIKASDATISTGSGGGGAAASSASVESGAGANGRVLVEWF
jgi:hypothetical protein